MKTIALICPYDDSLPLQVTSYRAFMPRYGLMAVAAALKKAGYGVTTWCEFSGSRIDWPAVLKADAVCFSLMSFSSLRGYEYAARVRAGSAAPIVFGGSHASVLPEDSLNHCDYVVRNEGEATIVELLGRLFAGGGVDDVAGISFKAPGGAVVHNPDRAFIKELDAVADPGCIEGYGPRSAAFYVRDALRNGIPRFNIAVAQSSRGCPFNCRFCFVKQELGREYRMREPEIVLREVEESVAKLRTRFLFFADNDFTLNRAHALDVLRLLEERFRGDIDIFFFARIYIARDEELMRAIERAGRLCIAVGVESVNPDTLALFDKPQREHDIHECMELFGRYRVNLQLLFVFGSDADTPESIRGGLELALRHGVYNWGFCSQYDFPGRERALGLPQLIPDNRFIHRDWRFYSGNFVVHYPKLMPPSVLQREMSAAYRKFYGANRNAFYQYHPIQATYKSYIPFLERAEAGLYTAGGELIEERLPGPSADAKRIDIRFNRLALAEELARFYAGNLTRARAWSFLLSMPGFRRSR